MHPASHTAHLNAAHLQNRDVKAVWSLPGTRLGFFTLIGTHFLVTVFTMMWGVPYLTKTQGMSLSAAGGLLTIPVVVFAVTGVPIGIISGRCPQHRPALVLALIGTQALVWTVVLAVPVRSPAWLLMLLIAVISIGEPFAAVAFDFVHTTNSPTTLGGYSPNAFRLAWASQYVVWAVAVAGVIPATRSARTVSVRHANR